MLTWRHQPPRGSARAAPRVCYLQEVQANWQVMPQFVVRATHQLRDDRPDLQDFNVEVEVIRRDPVRLFTGHDSAADRQTQRC
jgi:hypothetical protein